MVTKEKATEIAREYRDRFGFQLRGRLAVLSYRYPNVGDDSFLSWEGDQLTGADTTAKVRELLKVTPWIEGES